MKHYILTLASFFILSSVFCQEINSAKTASDYRQMSKDQQIGGVILLGAGITTIAIASQADIPLDDLPTVIILGGLATVGGAALLIASGNNKRKYRELSADLSFKKPIFEEMAYAKQEPIPSITLKFKF